MAAGTDTISSELPCHICGYDLRAHPVEGRCPECGSSVAEARRVAAIPLRPAWRDSDARWRRRMLFGVWLLVFLPLMDFLQALEWTSSVRVPAIFEVGGYVRPLGETLLTYLRLYPMLIFCMGVVLLFSKERGRRRSRLDWTRRWGVICSYVVALMSAVDVLFICALVLAGITALFQSLAPRYQPGVTPFFLEVSTGWLRYGLYPKDASYVVLAAFSSIVVLLACVPLFNALRSSGPRLFAVILIAPLGVMSLVNLVRAGQYCFGFAGVTLEDIYWLGLYFRPQLLVKQVVGSRIWLGPDATVGGFVVEDVKWCAFFGIAVWLSVAQVLAWRGRKKGKAAVS